jgi:hypothetical protein
VNQTLAKGLSTSLWGFGCRGLHGGFVKLPLHYWGGLTRGGGFYYCEGRGKSEHPNPTFVDKLKIYCPSLYFSLSAWERDHLDSTFLLDLIPSPVADLGTFSETIPEGSDSVEVRVEPTPFPETTQETVTIEQPSILSVEDSSIAPGFREPDFSDHSLDRMITSLVPTYREASSPIPIPTYLGKEVMNREEPSGVLGESTCEGGILERLCMVMGLGV